MPPLSAEFCFYRANSPKTTFSGGGKLSKLDIGGFGGFMYTPCFHENAERSKTPPLNMFLGPVLHKESIAVVSGGS